MALVKILQKGNKIDKDALNAELDKQISLYQLKGEDEQKVRGALAKFRDYFASPEGKSFSVDPLTKKYTVTGPNNQQFEGSPDEIHRNWFTGNLQIKNDQDATSVAAAIFDRARTNLATAKTATTESSDIPKVSIGDIHDFAIGPGGYGNETNYGVETAKIKTDEGRQAKFFEIARNAIAAYKKDLAEGAGKIQAKDLNEVNALEDLLKQPNPNWEKVSLAAEKLGWTPSEFLLSSEEKATNQEQVTSDVFKRLGINADTAEALKKYGYTVEDPNWYYDKETEPWFRQLLEANRAHILKNPETGKHIIIKDNALFDSSVSNRFSPGYGYIWRNDPTIGFTMYNPRQAKWQADPYANRNIGRELITNIPNAKVIGWSNQIGTAYAKDPIGHRDFTQTLKVTKDDGSTETWNKISGNTYKDESGAVHEVNITGYGKDTAEIYDATKMFPSIPFVNLGSTRYNITDALEGLKNANPQDVGGKLNEYAKFLKWELLRNPNVKGTPLENDILEVLGKYQDKLTRAKSQGVSIQKDGGKIMFAQRGASFSEYLRKYAPVAGTTTPAPTTSALKMRNISGTWKDENQVEKALDIAAMGGDVLSFVPVLGVAGATTSTLANLAKDWEKHGKVTDWKQLGLNLGFIGASAVGLGGVKSLLKLGKTAETGLDIGKLVEKATKVALKPEERSAIEGISKLSDKLGTKNIAELGEKIKDLSPEEAKKAVDVLSKGSEALRVVKSSTTPILGSQTLGAIQPALEEAAKATEKFASGKFARGALRIGTMVPGVMAAPKVVSTIYNDGIGYTRPEDIENIAMAGSVGTNWVRDLRAVRAISRQASRVGSAAKTTINLSSGPIDVDPSIVPAKLKKSYFGLIKGTDKVNQEASEKFKEDIISNSEKRGNPLSKEQLDELNNLDFTKPENLKKIELIPETKTGAYNLGESAISATGNRNIDIRDYNIALKHLKKSAIKPPKISTPIKEKIKDVKTPKPLKESIFTLDTKSSPSVKKGLENIKVLNRRKSLIKNWEPYGQGVAENKKGGVLKFKDGSNINYTVLNNPSMAYSNLAKNNKFLSYTPVNKVAANWQTKDGKYTPEYINFLKGLDQNWFNQNKDRLNNFLQSQGSNVRVNNLEQLVGSGNTPGWANDYKYGPIHNFMTKEFAAQPMLEVTVYPRKTQGGLANVPIGTGKGVLPVVGKAATWLGKNINATDLANMAMYANTVATNRRAGDIQRMAAEAGRYQLPYMSSAYIRSFSPYSFAAQKQASTVQGTAERMAAATSDINKGMGARLSGTKQASDILFKGTQADQQAIAQAAEAQRQANYKVDAYNLGILGKNRALNAGIDRQIALVGANQAIAQNAALNNLLTMSVRNMDKKKYIQTVSQIPAILNNPDYQAKLADYNKAISDETKQEFYNKYIDSVEAKYKTPFEDSSYGRAWKAKIDAASQPLKKYHDQLNALNISLQYPSWKLGGTISRKEEIEEIKEANERRRKDTEDTYKTILHNNQMMEKSLIKIFK